MSSADALAVSGSAATLRATIVLPCFNEQDHVVEEILRITSALDASEYRGRYELIVIDDASTDATSERIESLLPQFPQIRFMPFRRNGGSGTARRIGTAEARGDLVVWTDADMTYPNERIPELLRHLDSREEVDQVVGARRVEAGTHRWLRVPAKWTIRKLAEYLASTSIPDLNSGLRAFRREAALPYLRLLPPGFSCVTTLTLAFLSNQRVIEYVPIDYAKRSGASKFHPIHDAYRYILQVLRMIMYFNPLKVLMPIALWLLLLGAGKSVYDLVAHPVRIAINTILLIVTGMLLAALALLADLIVRSRTD